MVVVFLFFPQAFTGLLASNSEFTADMERTVLTIEGMTCESCARRLETALNDDASIHAAVVSFPLKKATVTFTSGHPSDPKRVRKLAYDNGFTAERFSQRSRTE